MNSVLFSVSLNWLSKVVLFKLVLSKSVSFTERFGEISQTWLKIA